MAAAERSPRQLVIIVAGVTFVALLALSLTKLVLYELPGRAPRLRAHVGDTISIRSRLGRQSGTVTRVGYQFNAGRWGFLDLVIYYKSGSMNGTWKISPSDAAKITFSADNEPFRW